MEPPGALGTYGIMVAPFFFQSTLHYLSYLSTLRLRINILQQPPLLFVHPVATSDLQYLTLYI